MKNTHILQNLVIHVLGVCVKMKIYNSHAIYVCSFRHTTEVTVDKDGETSIFHLIYIVQSLNGMLVIKEIIIHIFVYLLTVP